MDLTIARTGSRVSGAAGGGRSALPVAAAVSRVAGRAEAVGAVMAGAVSPGPLDTAARGEIGTGTAKDGEASRLSCACHQAAASTTTQAQSSAMIVMVHRGIRGAGCASGIRAMSGTLPRWRSFSDFLSASSMNDMSSVLFRK
jgi:hypothetical protein